MPDLIQHDEPADAPIGPDEGIELTGEATAVTPPEEPSDAVAPTEEKPAAALPPPSEYEVRLRQENADYRQRFQPYERALDGYTEEEADAWLTLISLAKSDDPAEAQQAREYMAQMAAVDVAAQAPVAGLTEAQVAKMLDERFQAIEDQRQEAEAINSVVTEAGKLGYTRDSEDYILLLHYANEMPDPDLGAADAKVKAYKQSQIDAFLHERGMDAANTPQIPTGGGVPPSLIETPKTWAEARASAEERFKAAQTS